MVAKTAGVISTPFRVSRHVKSSQKVLVVASDGLWDFVPNEEAILIATQANDSRTAAVRRSGWWVGAIKEWVMCIVTSCSPTPCM